MNQKREIRIDILAVIRKRKSEEARRQETIQAKYNIRNKKDKMRGNKIGIRNEE